MNIADLVNILEKIWLSMISTWMVAGVSLFLSLFAHWVVFAVLDLLSKRTKNVWDNLLVTRLRGPARLAFLIFGLQFARPVLGLQGTSKILIEHLMSILAIATTAWFIARFVRIAGDLIMDKHHTNSSDNLHYRKMQTQVAILRNVVITIIVITATSMILITFDGVRQIGISILASAGIAGVILGFAAQKTISNLFAGIQLAITQPIRIDDVVIVENEWGWIEEITLTYVVVKIWDLRRLILPISYFLEHPIQNWTRSKSEIIGSVILHCDPRTDIEKIRCEAKRLASLTTLWDGKVCGVQVTESRLDSIEVRILVSASDSSKCWDLRCIIREQLLAFIRDHLEEATPNRRIRLVK